MKYHIPFTGYLFVILHMSFLLFLLLFPGLLGKATGLTWVLAQKGWQTLFYSIGQEERGKVKCTLVQAVRPIRGVEV
jgi:hypothetical protein